MGFENVGL